MNELFANIAEAIQLEKKEAALGEEDDLKEEEEDAEEDESLAPNAFEVQAARQEDSKKIPINCVPTHHNPS